ncbi:MAG: hypothetical protein U5R06_19760 [candidate division KSB1 bacterium]|nr:hypothetical protein [candidate division KSB1 bacterium]
MDEVFAFPISLFSKQNVKEYNVRLEMHPSVFDQNGKETVLLPVKELGLPETYHQPWHGRPHRILVYPTSKGSVWGITAEIISEIIKLL